MPFLIQGLMIGVLSKKIRFLFELDTLYPYIFHRLRVKLRTLAKRPPPYPYEEAYRFDPEIENVLKQIQEAIPPAERGDNPAFNKHWKNIFDREQIAARVSERIRQITGARPPASDPGQL